MAETEKRLIDDELNKLFWMLFAMWALWRLGEGSTEKVLRKEATEISKQVAKYSWDLNDLINGMIKSGVDEELVIGIVRSQGVEVYKTDIKLMQKLYIKEVLKNGRN